MSVVGVAVAMIVTAYLAYRIGYRIGCVHGRSAGFASGLDASESAFQHWDNLRAAGVDAPARHA